MGRFTTFVEGLEPRTLLAAEAIWIEGEAFAASTFNQHSWYRDTNIDKSLLSGRNWHVHYSNGPSSATATYNLTVQQGGTYWWWLRLNPFKNSYFVSIDNAAFAPLDVSAVASTQDLVDPGIDIRFIGWSFGGKLYLSAGTHSVRIRVTTSTGETHGGLDVMALTNYPWAPTGIIPPDLNAPPPGPDDWFMFAAGPDEFSADSIIDMSGLLEETAGSHGFLQRQGDDLVFADGTPAKFWGMDAGMASTVEAQERQARFYAKHGVNMVRQHPVESVLGLLQKNETTGERSFDPAKLDRWDRWFSSLKSNGIYMTWSMFFPHVITEDDGYPADLYAELPSATGGKSSSGMVSFMPQLQQAQWEWARRLMEHVNPYTGLAYKDDPALAVVEVHNEDSIFWHWPLNDLAAGTKYPLHTAQLKLQWQQWVKARYGDDTGLRAAWGTGFLTGDSVNNPSMKIYGAWEMGAGGPPSWEANEKKRMADFIRFLAETQAGFYARRQAQLRDIGYRAVTVSTAWIAGGPGATAANLWTDDVMDAIDRHAYFGGSEGNWQIVTTDSDGDGKPGEVNNATHLSTPGGGLLGSGMFQVEDKPFIITEWDQQPPNQWKAEASPLMAFYGMGLQGWDALYHFAGSRSYYGNGWPDLRSYVSETPHYMGQFPALAFAIQNGHFDEGDPAAARRLTEAQAFQGSDALGALSTPAAALAVGRVSTKVADGQQPSYAADLSPYWDQTAKIVESNTGQLAWDYGRRIVTAHSQKTQAIIGFAGGYQFDLPGVSVEVQTQFVSLIFTPLDNRPLITSEHILITAMARDQNYGAEYSADGTQLLKAGMEPLMLEPVRAMISLKGQPIQSVRVVDVYGVPTSRQVERTGNSFSIDGRYATYYYEITRGPADLVPGSSGDGTIHLSLDPADAGMVAVSTGSNAWSVPLAALGELRIDGAGGTHRVEIDLALGNPIPAGGLRLDNGSFTVDASAALPSLLLAVEPDAALIFNRSQRIGALDLAAGARAAVVTGAAAVLSLDELRLAEEATLDLGDNDLIVAAGADPAAVIQRLRAAIGAARNTATPWSGPGLTTSAATPITGLSLIPRTSDILVKHTYHGDMDGDGTVDGADYLQLDRAFLNGDLSADITFDGQVDGDDFFLADRAYLGQSAILAPEPAASLVDGGHRGASSSLPARRPTPAPQSVGLPIIPIAPRLLAFGPPIPTVLGLHEQTSLLAYSSPPPRPDGLQRGQRDPGPFADAVERDRA